MPEWFEKLLTLYGPLGMGWPIAWYLWQHSLAIQGKLDAANARMAEMAQEALQDSTSTINALRVKMEEIQRQRSHAARRSATR